MVDRWLAPLGDLYILWMHGSQMLAFVEGAFVRVDVRSGRLRIDQAGLGEREGESEECEAVIRGSWSRVYFHLLCDEYTISAY